ncbi:MAG TPA: TetR/AcrR family transcriptional regulator [Novosphingobium sp.]|nr:TetR/AcrR family transcriptional regulator [Novosphingobium sp.]
MPATESQGAATATKIPDTPGSRRVLEAAIAAFAQAGYEGASLRRIAGAAEVDAALIVHVFGSKARLWQACVDTVADRLISALDGARFRPGGSLVEAVECLLDIFCAHPASAQFILSEIVRQDERFDYVFARLVEPIHELMRAGMAGDGALTPRDEIRLLALSGAITTTVVSRQFMVRKGLLSADLDMFREELRHAVGSLLQSPGGAEPCGSGKQANNN